MSDQIHSNVMNQNEMELYSTKIALGIKMMPAGLMTKIKSLIIRSRIEWVCPHCKKVQTKISCKKRETKKKNREKTGLVTTSIFLWRNTKRNFSCK